MPRTHTYTFAKYDSVQVDVDVWVSDTPQQTPAPVLIWYHGGGLVQGNRKALAAHHQRAVDELGVVIVSPDYRLTPQIRVPELQDDLVALVRYVESQLAKDMSASGEVTQLDLTRIAISGSSAGGWIALWIALGMLDGLPSSFLSNIRAVAPIYPITTMKHSFFQQKQVPFTGNLDIPSQSFAPFKDSSAPVVSNTADTPLRNKLYMHAQQEALFPTLLFSEDQLRSGWLEKTDVSLFIGQSSQAQRGNWPPVYMVHGCFDSAVDIDQARLVEKALKDIGHDVTLEERADKDHLWDLLEPEETLDGYWSFLRKHLAL